MDQETFNLSIRKFLKMVGVNSQREIEQAVQKAAEQRLQLGEDRLVELARLVQRITFGDGPSF